MPSTRYNSMVSRRDTLRKIFIPKRQSPTGVYRVSTKEKAFGFSLLMHAEIESYIEDRIRDIAHSAFNNWKSTGTVTRPLLAMSVYREGGEIGFSEDIFQIANTKKFETVVHSCKLQFDSRVGKNHGIRLKSLTKLFMNIGMEIDPSENLLMASLDGFGAKRGDYAHRSPDRVMLAQTDPITEATEISDLINRLVSLDQSFDHYKLNCGI